MEKERREDKKRSENNDEGIYSNQNNNNERIYNNENNNNEGIYNNGNCNDERTYINKDDEDPPFFKGYDSNFDGSSINSVPPPQRIVPFPSPK